MPVSIVMVGSDNLNMTGGSFTFDKAGSFPYHCTIHPSMTATIQVS
jgi:plastocyanin